MGRRRSGSAMEEDGRGGVEAVELEAAVKVLVDHLVMPALPRGTLQREGALAPANQETVARQMHATVLLYNYYHRKQFPQLEFADPERFCMTASLTTRDDNLHVYLRQVHDHGTGGELSVTEKAVIDACDIAEALDATKDSPEMTTWPIYKVAVLLLDQAKKKCLVEHGSQTKGVLSILEKDIKTALGGTHVNDASVKEASNKSMALASEPYALQQIAYSEVELKTGIKRSNLRFLEEHRVYSLSEKRTATMLFVLQYEKTVNNNLKEMPLEVLIDRMIGPIFRSDPCLETTYVVECYHLLPYKEVMLNILNRELPLDSSLCAPKERLFPSANPSFHSEIDESLKEFKANSKSKIQKVATNVSALKKNKQVVKEVGEGGTNNGSFSKNQKNSNTNSKRKSETFRATLPTYPEHGNGESPAKETDSLAAPDVESSKFGSAKPTISTNGGSADLQARVQMDKDDRAEKHSKSRDMPQDIFLGADVDPVIKNHALETQKEKDTEKSGVIIGNMNVQKYATLQLLQKMRGDILHQHRMLGDQGARCEMEIQTILTEGDMTPKVMSILKKYEDSWNMMEAADPTCSRKGCQTMNIKRKKLKEAILLRNKCQELDDICHESNWILPRYLVLPSVTGDMYQASVHLTGPDFNLSADGDRKITPHEARDSAASNMLYLLQQKAKEN